MSWLNRSRFHPAKEEEKGWVENGGGVGADGGEDRLVRGDPIEGYLKCDQKKK